MDKLKHTIHELEEEMKVFHKQCEDLEANVNHE
jgi:uncharacterized protein YoxC